jgi:polyisoprenoid-binding protein YceI
MAAAVLACGVTLSLRAATDGRYAGTPAASRLTFTFEQAGAAASGQFRTFSTRLATAGDGAPTTLEVEVALGSLDTKDRERDEALRGAEFFDVKRFPEGRFVSQRVTAKGEGRFEAAGRLTIRDVTRDVAIPFTLKRSGTGTPQEMTGEVTIRRLEFGVGQGEWRSTEWVGDPVRVSFTVPLGRAP